jgi:broad specificity phosphatase PhoE
MSDESSSPAGAAAAGAGPQPAAADTTVVHLLRHGEVENPKGVIYGRIPGFGLSEDGRMMAKAAADYLAERDVVAIFTSPLERARETAEPLSERFRLDPIVDDRLIEPWNHFEGLVFGVGDGSLKRLEHWWYLRNPFRPSWGEQYRLVAARMLAAMGDARDAARGHEAVCVSHQLPIWVTRRSVEGKRLWHHPSNRECALASVTSFTFTGDTITDVKYSEPARRLTSHGGTAQ